MDVSHEPTAAALPLLATKYYAPRWRPGLVSRPHLLTRLDHSAGGTLTLVAAPAGFGKSTLLGEWLAMRSESERPAAWVSLDSGDNDPALFWTYAVTALKSVLPEVGASSLSLLQSPQPPPIELVLTALINELAPIEDGVTLVLDDFHVIDASAIHAGIAFLLDHLPPRMRLVIASRSDPPLPLARLRSHGNLTEVRATDLRFTADEVATFLNDAMGLDLSATDVAALEARTEGWIAGLQLAALSLRGRHDMSDFVASFTGDDRYILDYLVEEVLQRQTDQVRSFLLKTAILDRLSGSLCDAVTGGHDGARLLETLERGNLFVVPLDDKRRWYRYHHLFADVLRAQGTGESPDRVDARHQHASAWFEQHGSTADAIRHALAAGNVERVASLIELAIPAMRRSRQEATLLGWCRALPDDLIRQRPVISAEYAASLMATGILDGVDDRLRDAERWLDRMEDARARPESSDTAMIVVNEDEFRRLPGALAVYRAGLALAQGEVPTTITLARRAIALVAIDDYVGHGAAAAILGLAAWASGDLDTAHQSYAEGMAFLQQAGYIADSVGGVIALADIRIAQGRLRDALSTYERTLRFVQEQGEPVLRGTADVHVGMSERHYERNDLDVATYHLETSKELGEHTGFPQYPYRWRVAMAQIAQARGDFVGALDLLDEAERRYVGDFHPYVRPIAAMKARVWVIQGRLGDALRWTMEHGLSTDDDLTYLREYAHITLARVLIADQDSVHEALGFLERLLSSAENGGRMGSVIEILVLQALAQPKQGKSSRALMPLERALTLAEPENYVRMFVNEGERMRDLLRFATAKGIASAYTRRLLDAFGEPVGLPSIPQQAPAVVLAEPLTAREIEILRLIAAGMRNQEIADRLFIGLATVKRHVANAYGKLGVDHRTEAVAMATELNLL